MHSRAPHARTKATGPMAALLAVALFAAGCGGDAATDVAAPPASQSPTLPQSPTLSPSPTLSQAPAAGMSVAATGDHPNSTATRSDAMSAPTVKAAAGGGAVFRPFAPGATAITYDTGVVPSGATAKATVSKAGAGVKVRLVVTGLKPRRGYGAHVHTDPCAAKPDAAGPHYQHLPDPKAVESPPSVDPKFANPRNEVWLDFTTDANGAATVTATQTWPFDEISPPRSLIVHAERTRTTPGKAGTAGPRVACVTLPL